jgi:predicted MFS family arabinose efflux permease
VNPVHTQTADLRLLFSLRAIRLFAYGFIAVVLVLYLTDLGLSTDRIGLLLTLTYFGDAVISLGLTTHADRWGRRRTLKVGLFLMILGGAVFAATGNFWLLLAAATVGVISPSGNEVGPFIAIEQACLAQVVTDAQRTRMFAWYHVTGFTAGAVGAAFGGLLAGWLQQSGWTTIASYRALCCLYAFCGCALLLLNARLDASVEPQTSFANGIARGWLGLRESRSIVTRLSFLFAADSFAGGFIVQSFVAYWFYRKFGVSVSVLGGIFFGTNLLSGLSALLAVPLAKRIGLVNTMVWTHLPSNLLLMFVPVMPTLTGTVIVLLLRNAISQMDVPTRLSYVNAVVPAAERSAANGVTSTARQIGVMLAPLAVGPLMAHFEFSSFTFWICGGLKIVYDLCLWTMFRAIKPPEEI